MEDSRRSADRDLERARGALERGDVRHAADHLATAITHAPTLPETHELLSRLAARTDGALDLFPLEQHAFVGTVVARAHLLAAAGRPEAGLPLLAAASGHTPDVDWAGVPWVIDPALGVRMDPGLLARIVMRLCTAIGDPAPESGRPTLQPYLTLMQHAVAASPRHHLLLGAGSALARRVGAIELAVDWAERGARAQPSKLGEIWLGYAYRNAGRTQESLAALRRAVAYDPDDLSVYADIAGTLADSGRIEEALDWVDRALAMDPAFDCAVHTAHRLRFRADGELGHLVALADFTRDHPDDTHEHTDLADCCAGTPWLCRVPAAPATEPDQRRRPPSTTRPSEASIERLSRVARAEWAHPPAAYDAALELMMIEPDELLALLSSPPEPARSARVWACLGLLHHGTDEPWIRSARRRRLVELAVSGADQITEAALFALVTYAWIDPAARPDVAALVTGRLVGVTRPVPSPIAWSVAQLALATPGMRAETRQLAASVVQAPPGIPRPRRRRARRQLLRWLANPR
ncbi:MAG TPA: tetratricopeptide repeat protein [Actinoplanes sp.]|nr:tetratricopeptide repeat protein [Actinoplanes sp.]